MNEKECLYRVLGMLEGSEELGGIPLSLRDKIKQMIQSTLNRPVTKQPETTRATVTTNTGQQVVVKHPEIVDYNNTKYWATSK